MKNFYPSISDTFNRRRIFNYNVFKEYTSFPKGQTIGEKKNCIEKFDVNMKWCDGTEIFEVLGPFILGSWTN